MHAKNNSLSETTRSLSQGPRQTISCRPRRPTQNPTLCPHLGGLASTTDVRQEHHSRPMPLCQDTVPYKSVVRKKRAPLCAHFTHASHSTSQKSDVVSTPVAIAHHGPYTRSSAIYGLSNERPPLRQVHLPQARSGLAPPG